MRVMEGESFAREGDGKWIKLEVQMDYSDLIRILTEWGVDNPGVDAAYLKTSLVFDILSVAAQRLIAVRSFTARGMTREELQAIFDRLNPRIAAQQKAVAEAFKEHNPS